MKLFQKVDDIKYLAAQIYERFRDKNYWATKTETLEHIDQISPNITNTSIDELRYSVLYSNPGVSLYTKDFTFSPELPEYYQLFILEAESDFFLTIRNSPIFRDGIRISGKLVKQNRKVKIRKCIESGSYSGGLKNLVILDKNTDIDEISLQAGIYLYRAKLSDEWVLFELFRNMIERNKKSCEISAAPNIDKIFMKLLSNYRLPNNSKSFRSYIKMLSKDLEREIYNNDQIYKSVIDIEKVENSYNKINIDVKDTNMNDIEVFGIPKSTIYRWIREDKLSVPKLNGYYQWDQINKAELFELNKRRKSRGTLTELIKVYSEKRNIKFESAKRAIKRWKRKGLSLKEIAMRIKVVSKDVSN